jgi:hypothetical protein
LPTASRRGAGQSDGARLDDLARQAARDFRRGHLASARSDASRGTDAATGTQVELTLDEATARALERNLDIAVERLNPRPSI